MAKKRRDELVVDRPDSGGDFTEHAESLKSNPHMAEIIADLNGFLDRTEAGSFDLYSDASAAGRCNRENDGLGTLLDSDPLAHGSTIARGRQFDFAYTCFWRAQ